MLFVEGICGGIRSKRETVYRGEEVTDPKGDQSAVGVSVIVEDVTETHDHP